MDMWTIGFAERHRFPRFPSKLGKQGNARLRPQPTGTTANREIDIDGAKRRIVTQASAPTAIGAGIETRGATP